MEVTYGKRPVQSSKHQTYTHMGEVTLVWCSHTHSTHARHQHLHVLTHCTLISNPRRDWCMASTYYTHAHMYTTLTHTTPTIAHTYSHTLHTHTIHSHPHTGVDVRLRYWWNSGAHAPDYCPGSQNEYEDGRVPSQWDAPMATAGFQDTGMGMVLHLVGYVWWPLSLGLFLPK